MKGKWVFIYFKETISGIKYSRVWNKRTPLNKRSPMENLAKRIIVAPFLPYTMKSGKGRSPWKKVKKIIIVGLCLFRTLEYL